TNRLADNWRPLLAIADQMGGDWPAMARAVAVSMVKTDLNDLGPLPMPPDAHGTVDPRTIVIPPDRNRQFFDHKGEASLKSLRESIARWGLIHSPVITRDNVLVVGERRVRCCLELVKTDARFEQIGVRYPDKLTPDELRAIELEENIKRADTLWHERELAL